MATPLPIFSTLTHVHARYSGRLRTPCFHPSSFALPEELALLKSIARFPDSIVAAAESYAPHRIAGRIYRLARDFSAFYDKAPVLKAETPELRDARLYLVEMAGKVLATGLALLGIEVTDRM